MSISIRLRFVTLTIALLLILAPGSLYAIEAGQTIPTRTPTPGATTPTPSPGGGGDPTATQPPPQQTATSEPAATETVEPTATDTATLPPTPQGGLYPTASPCSLQPTVQAVSGRVNARGGPGPEYDLVGDIQFLEVRPIIGRSGDSPWWQITLAGGTVGWVADAFVQIQGYTGLVPIVAPPALPGGAIPTTGAGWNPTPNPACTPPPSSTPTPTASATVAPTSTELPVEPTEDSQPVTGASAEAAVSDTASDIQPTTVPHATATAVPPPTSVLTATGAQSEEPELPTAAPLEADDAAGNSASLVDWLPVIGAGLIVTGVAIYFVRRR